MFVLIYNYGLCSYPTPEKESARGVLNLSRVYWRKAVKT